jgi:hypothetical protein
MRLKRGDVVEIHFLDHVEGGDRPYEFAVFGRVGTVDKLSVTVESWAWVDAKERDTSNLCRFVIVRAAITRWWKLERVS